MTDGLNLEELDQLSENERDERWKADEGCVDRSIDETFGENRR